MITVVPLILLAVIMYGRVMAQETGAGKVAAATSIAEGEPLSAEAFAALRRKINSEGTPGLPVPAARPLETAATTQIVLKDGKHWTTLPPGSLFVVPEPMLHHTGALAFGGLPYLAHAEFLRGRAWLRSEIFSREEVTGEKPVPAVRWKTLKSSEQIIVAVLEGTGSPVTSLRLKPQPAGSGISP